MKVKQILRAALSLSLLALVACGPPKPEGPPDRPPGARTPLSSNCDPVDPARCALPWPSNTFTVTDASTKTGLRLALDRKALPAADEVTFLNLADGFSRMSPLLTAFPGSIDEASLGSGDATAIRLIVAQPGAPDEGAFVPIRMMSIASTSQVHGDETLLIGYPQRPLAANSDHVAIVMDSLKAKDGSAFEADALTKIALGLQAPTTDDERARAAYHAPTRAILQKANVDPSHVLRVWDFTTRSQLDPRVRLASMRAQAIASVKAGTTGVAIDKVTIPTTGSVEAIVMGRLTGLPEFRTAETVLAFDESGLPKAQGVHDAPFRMMIPKGAGDYRIVLYGHGTGGSVDDDTFDETIAANGLGKAGALFYGWDGTQVLNTFLALGHVQHGVAQSSTGLMQALADFSALEEALNGPLADVLSAPMLGGAANPAVGRKPDAKEPLWTGGSLGGTLGFVYSGLSPRVRYAVLNVPGAGWTHFIPGSEIFTTIGPSLQANYSSALDFWETLMVSQLLWDDVDGGNWSDPDELTADGAAYLVQESIGDPVLPNPGSDMVAAATQATPVGGIVHAVPGLPASVESIDGHSGFTQFVVPDGVEGLDRHGFANRGTKAGDAAREQISTFIHSALMGTPHIEVPSLCRTNTVPDSCDFSKSP